jgi:hypothetical protein
MNATTLLEHLPVGTDSIMGHARLDFELPKGRIAGRGELFISVRGRPRLKVRVEQFYAEPPYDSSPIPFLTGADPIKAERVVSFSLGARECRFTSLLLETDTGTFSATAGIVEPNEIYPTVESVTATILDLVFTPREAREPRFWLATLHCSCSDFAMNRPANHVLAFPDRMLYPFQDNQRYCAFQPLAYEADSSNVPFDAIIFGDLDTCRDFSTAIEALPTGILHALAFGLGGEVLMSRLELRDVDGHVVRRDFFSTSLETARSVTPCFTIFDDGVGSGIAAFLTKFLTLPAESRRELIPAMNLIRSGAPGGRPIEDSITDLVRALDNLVRAGGLAQQNLLDSLAGELRERVRNILRDATAQIRRLRASAPADSLTTSVLERMEGRVANAGTTDLNFGISLRILAEKHGLNDFTVLGEHSSLAGFGYEGLLSFMRGQVIHEGHLNIETRSQLRAWFEFAQHLHDLGKRLILHAISYVGTYQPSNTRFLGPRPLDWVKSEMTLPQLGFSQGLPRLPNTGGDRRSN